jgi:hypothetical protein
MYATGLVDVRFDDVQVFPDVTQPIDKWKTEALDRNLNELIVRGERFYSAVWDNQLHVACRATLDT